ncbi:MAG TPA: MFS transporter [Candidatus Binataceae bacterium]|nr:MFS transporter [Candidatus Binataceae bacterium]
MLALPASPALALRRSANRESATARGARGCADRGAASANGRDEGGASSGTAIIAAIVLLLIYQGYSLSIVGVAAPWIAKSFSLNEAQLAELFAWISISALGALGLARLADRVGRRLIILASLALTPLFALGAALARSPKPFAVFEILISALLGGSVSSAIALLAEELPGERRAAGQAFAAFASALGGVLSYIVIPFLLQWGYSWRWLLAPCVAGLALVLPVARMLPVDGRWARLAAARQAGASHIYDVFGHLYRRRALTLLGCAALDSMAGTAVNGWLYFEAVSVIGLSPQQASTLVVVGMLVGMAGFPVGAWTSNRFGRVPTVTYVGGAAWLGALAFYWGPPNLVTWPLTWLLVAYCWFKLASSVMTVGANSAATELFPATLRTTMIGWQGITGAVFSMFAQVLIAALIAPLGGLTRVVGYFALLGFPSAALFGLFIDETRGLPLEVAAKEAEWAGAQAGGLVNSDRAAERGASD